MYRKKGKRKPQNTQHPIKTNGRTSLPLITLIIITFIFIAGLLISQISPSYFSNLRPSSRPPASVVEKSKCATPSQTSTTPIPEAKVISWLEMPSKVKTGTTVSMTLWLKNVSDEAREINMEAAQDHIYMQPEHSISVVDGDGKIVWERPPVSNLHLGLFTKLTPGHSVMMEDQWPLVDNRGNTVPSGTYFVQGIASGVKTCLMILTILP